MEHPATPRLLAAALLALIATAPPAAAAMQVFGPGALSVSGTAGDCFTAITPIALFGPQPVLVLTGFTGTVNNTPLTNSFLAVQLNTGSISCTPSGGGYLIGGGGSGTAVSGP